MEYMRRVENMPGTEQVPSVHDSCRFGNLERTGTETVLRTESDQGQYFLSVRAKTAVIKDKARRLSRALNHQEERYGGWGQEVPAADSGLAPGQPARVSA